MINFSYNQAETSSNVFSFKDALLAGQNPSESIAIGSQISTEQRKYLSQFIALKLKDQMPLGVDVTPMIETAMKQFLESKSSSSGLAKPMIIQESELNNLEANNGIKEEDKEHTDNNLISSR
jgi:hypothetical protein